MHGRRVGGERDGLVSLAGERREALHARVALDHGVEVVVAEQARLDQSLRLGVVLHARCLVDPPLRERRVPEVDLRQEHEPVLPPPALEELEVQLLSIEKMAAGDEDLRAVSSQELFEPPTRP